MTIGDRIKEIRKFNSKTQDEFAKSIGVGQAALSALEKGSRNVTDRNISIICNAYNINEEWLRNGAGEMSVENDKSILSLLQKQYNLPSDQLAVVESFLSISNDQREAITAYLDNLCGRLNVTSQYKEPGVKYDDDWKKRELADYAAELDAQEKGLLVSDGGVNSVTKKKKAVL